MNYVERPYIYVHHIGPLAPQTGVLDAPKRLQTDAPFALRGRSVRVQQTPTQDDQTGTQALLTRFKDSYGFWRQSEIIPVSADMQNNAGQGGNPGIVYPQVVFPAGSTINVDVFNNDPVQGRTVDVTLYYWGVKLYPAGAIDAPTYPAKCSMKPYWYGGVADGGPSDLVIPQLAISQVIRDQIFRVRGDADFACRTGQCGIYTLSPQFPANPFSPFHNLFVIMKDAYSKPFMDDWVDVNVLWGNAQLGTFGHFSGPANPGLFVPEIYMRANSTWLFDWWRDDALFNTAADGPLCIMLVLGGAKVYRQ